MRRAGPRGGAGPGSGGGASPSEGPAHPSCFLKVSRLEAQLLLERYPECGNLLLRPSGDGTGGVSVTTRQTLNGCACAAPGWAEGRAWGVVLGAGPKLGGAWDPEAGPSPGRGWGQRLGAELETRLDGGPLWGCS